MIRSDGDNRADELQRELDAALDREAGLSDALDEMRKELAIATKELSDCRRRAFERAVMRGEQP